MNNELLIPRPSRRVSGLGTGIKFESIVNPIAARVRFRLTDFAVPVTAASDFGSALLFNLRTESDICIDLVAPELTVTGTGGVTTVDSIVIALGTAAASSTSLLASEQNVLSPRSPSGGLITLGSSAGPLVVGNVISPLFLPATGSKAVYMNVAYAAASDGVAIFNGYLDVTYRDFTFD